MLEPGVVIGGRFRVDRVLGAGGMGVVVAATHTELGQQVALKVLHDELATNPMIVARFLREARAVAQLRTEHVCRVFDVGRLDSGAPFIVMEMLEGTDLGAVVMRGAVPMVIAVEYIIQACVALAEAHAVGLVHRDIKPPNLFVVRRPDGGPLVKVLDFGIAKAATAEEAKLTQTSSTMGSPGFMSPEQIRSTRDVDLRTDIWALGVTLYSLLSGRMPFPGTQLAEIAVAVMTAPPQPLQVDPALHAIVMRCLEKEPERRFASVAELAVALMAFGGPSAPRFVREITRGQVGGAPELPRAAPVPMHAPTAMTGFTQGPPAAPPLTAPPASPTKRGTWIAIGVVLVVALVGGGALAGYLARSGETQAPAPSPAADAAVAATIDAAVAIDAAPSNVDVWAGGDRPHTGSGEAEPAEAEEAEEPSEDANEIAKAQMKMARDMMTPEQRKQGLAQLRAMEKQIDALRKANPASYQQSVVGFTQAACLFDDAGLAQRMFDRIEATMYRNAVKTTCSNLGITLTVKATKN